MKAAISDMRGRAAPTTKKAAKAKRALVIPRITATPAFGPWLE